MAYDGIKLKNSISIEKLYSIHYFEYMSDFKFPGENHDFWEFVCVDKGEVSVTGGDRQFVLKRGEIAFHQPNEFHSVEATRGIAPNLVVISLDARIPPWIFSETVSFRSMRRTDDPGRYRHRSKTLL